MSILVTGGAGYIGSHMAHALIDKGESVIVADDLSTGYRWSLPDGCEFILCDIGDMTSVSRIFRLYDIEAIIHFAASIVVDESVSQPTLYYQNNTSNTRNLAECAIRFGINKFIFSSTAAVYGESSKTPIDEFSLTNPISPYGRSKLMSEWILSDISRAHNFSTVVLRYFNVAGADPYGRSGQSNPASTHLIKAAVQASLGIRDVLNVYGNDYPTKDGTCIRDYIQVTDLIDAHMKALDYLRQGGENLVCNVGYETGYSVYEVINTVKDISGVDFEVKSCPRRNGDAPSIVASNSLIMNELGWSPKFNDLSEIVKQAHSWELKLDQLQKSKSFKTKNTYTTSKLPESLMEFN
jgi:UDP-glucose 4-epimerase